MENNKPVFYMLVGLPASGKSSESDRLGDVIVRSSDYLRDKLCGDINDMKNNGAVFTILQSLVRADLYHSKDVVYDATNLKASYALYVNDGHVQHKRFLPADKLSVGGKAKYLKNRNQKGIMLKESYVNGSFFMEKGMQDAKPRLNRLVESFLQQIGREIEGGSL